MGIKSMYHRIFKHHTPEQELMEEGRALDVARKKAIIEKERARIKKENILTQIEVANAQKEVAQEQANLRKLKPKFHINQQAMEDIKPLGQFLGKIS